MLRSLLLLLGIVSFCLTSVTHVSANTDLLNLPWSQIVARARGQTVYWNAWAGNDGINRFIAWVGQQMQTRYDITVYHVRLRATSEAVARVVAEKAAARHQGGSVDLIWINGPNFLTMKQQNLHFGPFTHLLPNYPYVDVAGKPSTVVDFTVPVDGLAAPWSLAQIVFVYDSVRLPDPPRSMSALLEWLRHHPGRFTHPTVHNFLGTTFLKQALYEFIEDVTILQRPVTAEAFTLQTSELWTWYDQLKPLLWRHGRHFPQAGSAQRQLLADREIDLMISFQPSSAAWSIEQGLLPPSTRTFVLEQGTIGNTSFVSIPYNASHKEGAMVVANFLLSAEAQARAADYRHIGQLTVLDVDRLPLRQRGYFDSLERHPAMLSTEDLGLPLLEPHPSWMTQMLEAWLNRYGG